MPPETKQELTPEVISRGDVLRECSHYWFLGCPLDEAPAIIRKHQAIKFPNMFSLISYRDEFFAS